MPRSQNSREQIKIEQISEAVADLESKVLVKKTQREIDIENMLGALAELGGQLTAEEDIEFKGTKLILPESMQGDMKGAIKFLNEKVDEDERTVSFSRTFHYRMWDGAHATMTVLKRTFGAMSQRATMTMFGPEPPELHTINVGVKETTQVPWGRLAVIHLPGLDLYLQNAHDDEFGTVFRLICKGPRKYRHHVEGIFRAIEAELETNSIYRGKAFDGQQNPSFIDLSGTDPSKVVYSDVTLEQLETCIWAYLKWPEQMKEVGMSLKRAVLLHGGYGTGKSLAAVLTAQIAVANGQTFIMCRPGQDDLMDVMNTARLYQPAVVFFEDIDTLTGASSHIPRLLDVFDGIRAKDTQIMCVLTTNFVERIHKAMLRPGRLDAVIEIGALDRNGTRRLVEALVPPEMLADGIDWDDVFVAHEGFTPSFSVGAIDRAKGHNINRNQGKASQLTTHDLVAGAIELRNQLHIMEGAKDTVPQETLTKAFTQLIGGTVAAIVPAVVEQKMNGALLRDMEGEVEYQIETH